MGNNIFDEVSRYCAYCKCTDEKEKLCGLMAKRLHSSGRILDIGSGIGVNTSFLADKFPDDWIDAVEQSKPAYDYACANNNRINIRYHNVSFENFYPQQKYDFILASHFLQYSKIEISSFLKSALSLMKPSGELWIVQQTRKGLAEIIHHQQKYLTNPFFSDWKTFEDYELQIKMALPQDYDCSSEYLDTSIDQINFSAPSENDKLRLEFILGILGRFDEQSEEFKQSLAMLNLGDGKRIFHPNGVLMIRRKP